MSDMDISQEVVDFFENLNEEATEEAVQEPTEETDGTEPGDDTGGASEDAEDGSESTEEESEEADEEQGDDEGGEEDELHPSERARREQQAIYDRKIAELQNNLAQMNEWAQQQYAWQQQVMVEQQQAQQQQLHVSKDELDQAIDANLPQTFQWVVANRPDLVPAMTSMVREKEQFGHQVADQMLFEFNEYQRSQQLQAMQEYQAQVEAPQHVENTMQGILGSLEQMHGENFVALKDDIAMKAAESAPQFRQFMTENGYEITPQAIADFITRTYFEIREERLNHTTSKPRGPQKLAPNQHVENSNATKLAATTPDEDAINEILNGARQLSIDTSAS